MSDSLTNDADCPKMNPNTQNVPMKPYPLGLDNPYTILGIIGTTRWAIYRREPFQKIAEFATQTQAYDARRAIVEFENHLA